MDRKELLQANISVIIGMDRQAYYEAFREGVKFCNKLRFLCYRDDNEIPEITKKTDDDGHWYWIPNELTEKFDEDFEKIAGKEYMECPDDFDDFTDLYERYATGGAPDLVPDYFTNLEIINKLP